MNKQNKGILVYMITRLKMNGLSLYCWVSPLGFGLVYHLIKVFLEFTRNNELVKLYLSTLLHGLNFYSNPIVLF